MNVPQERCRCGFCGPIYSFVTVNGKRSCVRCAGSPEMRGKSAQPKKMRAAALRGLGLEPDSKLR